MILCDLWVYEHYFYDVNCTAWKWNNYDNMVVKTNGFFFFFVYINNLYLYDWLNSIYKDPIIFPKKGHRYKLILIEFIILE